MSDKAPNYIRVNGHVYRLAADEEVDVEEEASVPEGYLHLFQVASALAKQLGDLAKTFHAGAHIAANEGTKYTTFNELVAEFKKLDHNDFPDVQLEKISRSIHDLVQYTGDLAMFEQGVSPDVMGYF